MKVLAFPFAKQLFRTAFAGFLCLAVLLSTCLLTSTETRAVRPLRNSFQEVAASAAPKGPGDPSVCRPTLVVVLGVRQFHVPDNHLFEMTGFFASYTGHDRMQTLKGSLQ